jgi:hypothetical protein
MDVSEHPLPTPPSIPPDTVDRLPSPQLYSDDLLSASPDLSHHAVVDAFTSDVRDQPQPTTTTFRNNDNPSRSPSNTKVNIPHADSSVTFDRPLSEPPVAMDVDQGIPAVEMVNGHKGNGEYTAEDLFSGPAVESPEPTNEPTPPATIPAKVPSPSSGAPPLPSTSETTQHQSTNNFLATPQPPPTVFNTSPKPTVPSPSVNTDVEMKDTFAASFKASKPLHEAPPANEPPAKRVKTESSQPSDPSKKLPANQQKFLHALLRQVKKSKDAFPFLEPVDPVKLNIPRYFDIIHRPMDISTIEKKINTGMYSDAQGVVKDFALMIDNCVTFNGPDNPVTKMGKNIQGIFEKGMKTLPPEHVLAHILTLSNCRYRHHQSLLHHQ